MATQVWPNKCVLASYALSGSLFPNSHLITPLPYCTWLHLTGQKADLHYHSAAAVKEAWRGPSLLRHLGLRRCFTQDRERERERERGLAPVCSRTFVFIQWVVDNSRAIFRQNFSSLCFSLCLQQKSGFAIKWLVYLVSICLGLWFVVFSFVQILSASFIPCCCSLLMQTVITLPVTQLDSLLTLAAFRPNFRPEQLITMFCDGTSFVAQQVAEQLMQDQQGSPHNARAHLAGLAIVGADDWARLGWQMHGLCPWSDTASAIALLPLVDPVAHQVSMAAISNRILSWLSVFKGEIWCELLESPVVPGHRGLLLGTRRKQFDTTYTK